MLSLSWTWPLDSLFRSFSNVTINKAAGWILYCWPFVLEICLHPHKYPVDLMRKDGPYQDVRVFPLSFTGTRWHLSKWPSKSWVKCRSSDFLSVIDTTQSLSRLALSGGYPESDGERVSCLHSMPSGFLGRTRLSDTYSVSILSEAARNRRI